ncbi:ATP-binding cassette domain-containing protein [Pedobacter sp. UC225_65]|uniref:ATP-binding cassette domain-containing protein n=1 Tax=Pedobacter sp. UC225_65 TaxID=3350173 RepID=UPI003672FBA6
MNRHDKIALIGHNGVGKSTLLKILAGNLNPLTGIVKAESQPYVVPQIFGQFNKLTIAEALQVAEQLQALTEILAGNATFQNMELLNDDWTIEDRCKEALAHWGLATLDLNQKLETLSGGQKTKVFLAGSWYTNQTLCYWMSPPTIWMTGAGISFMLISNLPKTLWL